MELPQPVPGSLNYLTIPYIPYKSYKNSKTNSSDYYQEFILHAGLMGVDRFLMWNTHAVGNDNIDASRSFDELETLLGESSRQWANQGVDCGWTQGFMLTAAALDPAGADTAAAAKQCIWRFTPDLKQGGDPAQFVKVKDGGVTLSGIVGSDGKTATVTIPGATVVKEARAGK